VRLAVHGGTFDSPEQWKGFVKDVRSALGSGVIAVGFESEAPEIFVTVSQDLVERGISAGDLVRAAMQHLDGRGGGRPEMAQGKGSRRDGMSAALGAIADTLGAAK
jgi:alanyl-tRNA synthetase